MSKVRKSKTEDEVKADTVEILRSAGIALYDEVVPMLEQIHDDYLRLACSGACNSDVALWLQYSADLAYQARRLMDKISDVLAPELPCRDPDSIMPF